MSLLDALGYKFQERMAGTWRTAQVAEARPYSFDLVASAPSFGSLARDQLLYLEGTLTLGGLAERVHATGTLRFMPWIRRRLEYELDFVADDGRRCHLSGLKTIRHLDPIRTWTTLPSRVVDSLGAELGTGTAWFPGSEFLPLVASFRLTRGRAAPRQVAAGAPVAVGLAR